MPLKEKGTRDIFSHCIQTQPPSSWMSEHNSFGAEGDCNEEKARNETRGAERTHHRKSACGRGAITVTLFSHCLQSQFLNVWTQLLWCLGWWQWKSRERGREGGKEGGREGWGGRERERQRERKETRGMAAHSPVETCMGKRGLMELRKSVSSSFSWLSRWTACWCLELRTRIGLPTTSLSLLECKEKKQVGSKLIRLPIHNHATVYSTRIIGLYGLANILG